MSKKKILITGSSGIIGSALLNRLSPTYEIRGCDLKNPGNIQDFHSIDGKNLKSYLQAFEGVDTVIDLASIPSATSPWEIIAENNIPCMYNALEAAKQSGVKRLIFASSNHVTGMYEYDDPYHSIISGKYDRLDPSNIPYITKNMDIRPDGPYGIGKALGEAAGRYYSDKFGLSVICLRIGSFNAEDNPLNARNFATLITHNDFEKLVSCSIEAPNNVKFDIFYGVSNNFWRFWDIENACSTIGYEPTDNAEIWR